MTDPVCVEKVVARAMCKRRNTGQCAAICLSYSSNITSHKCPEAARIWGEDARAAIQAHTAALREAGFVIVPREPTEAMCDAATRSTSAWLNSKLRGIELRRLKLRIRWGAMLDAAPLQEGS